MKFRSERDLLVEALSAASRVVASRSVGATSGVLLSLTGNRLTVTGTDLDITVRTTVDVIGITDGSTVVPARLLVDAVRSLEAGAVTVESDEDHVVVSLGRARFSLRTYAVVDYPKLPPVTGVALSVTALEMIQGLNQVVRAAATDDARPLLTGVLFTHDNNNLRLIATDSYRLAVRDVVGVSEVASNHDLLVPARALNELQRAAGSLPSDAEIGVTVTDAEIAFVVGKTTISSRLIDGNYPSVLQLIPASYPNHLRIAKDTFLTSLRRAKLLAKDSTSSVRLTMTEKSVEIRTQSVDTGDIEDNVDADYDGDELTIAFNPTFLIDGIEAVPGDEILLEMSDNVRPAMVRALDDSQFRYLLMPVRVQ
ncbi:MAG: DNA polymerase III subunit beta [Acidimicrobiaceae bacterium]|jgi:DNA polymerase-3 subunit beta|nr:DNA polymerase III subunit beta [Acidimicrobiaceae bacterium]